MNLIKTIYKKLKPIPVIGNILMNIRNIPKWKVFLNPRLRRKDYLKALRISTALFGKEAERILKEYRKSEIFKMSFSYGHSGDFDVYMLYIITRMIKPEVVIETGVASGRSSASILKALKENNKGRLYSIDLPIHYKDEDPKYYTTSEGNKELTGFVPKGEKPGWLVPDNLRDRWELIFGDSKIELPKLLKRLEKVDCFYHDSDHSYEYMKFEYNEVWPFIKKSGFLLSDDISWNKAYDELLEDVEYFIEYNYRNFGIIKK